MLAIYQLEQTLQSIGRTTARDKERARGISELSLMKAAKDQKDADLLERWNRVARPPEHGEGHRILGVSRLNPSQRVGDRSGHVGGGGINGKRKKESTNPRRIRRTTATKRKRTADRKVSHRAAVPRGSVRSAKRKRR